MPARFLLVSCGLKFLIPFKLVVLKLTVLELIALKFCEDDSSSTQHHHPDP